MPLNPRALEIDPDICGSWTKDELPSEVYHSLPGASPSQLWHWYGCTDAEARISLLDQDPDAEILQMGSICHQMVLEPDKPIQGIACYPETYTNEKGEKKPWHMAAGVCKAWRRMQRAAGNVTMFAKSSDRSKPGYEDIQAMVKAISEHSMMRAALRDEGTKTEVSVIHTFQNPELIVRSREDIQPAGVDWLADCKFTYDPDPETWGKHVMTRGYHIQAAMTLDIHNARCPKDQRTGWRWFAVGQKPPHLAAVIEASEEMIREGRQEYPKLLQRFERCYRTNEWPGFEERVYRAELPRKWKP